VRRIIWTAEAVANLRGIFDYVSAFNAPAAARLARRLQVAADSLGNTPSAVAKPSAVCVSWRSSIHI